MTKRELRIEYPDELLLALEEEPESFEAEARLLLAAKLYEMGKTSTGMAARLAAMGRVQFLFASSRLRISPMGQEPDEIADHLAHA